MVDLKKSLFNLIKSKILLQLILLLLFTKAKPQHTFRKKISEGGKQNFYR